MVLQQSASSLQTEPAGEQPVHPAPGVPHLIDPCVQQTLGKLHHSPRPHNGWFALPQLSFTGTPQKMMLGFSQSVGVQTHVLLQLEAVNVPFALSCTHEAPLHA